jgi:hypothetical protein
MIPVDNQQKRADNRYADNLPVKVQTILRNYFHALMTEARQGKARLELDIWQE